MWAWRPLFGGYEPRQIEKKNYKHIKIFETNNELIINTKLDNKQKKKKLKSLAEGGPRPKLSAEGVFCPRVPATAKM